MPVILARMFALMGNPVALVSVAAGVALSVLGFLYHVSQNRLTRANHTIGQLNGTIKFQNGRIEAFQAAVAAAQKRAAAAQKVVDAARDKDEQTITALLNRPLAPPELACKAANDLFLEFAK